MVKLIVSIRMHDMGTSLPVHYRRLRFMREVPVLQNISDNSIGKLSSWVEEMTLAKDESLPQPINALYLISNGSVCVHDTLGPQPTIKAREGKTKTISR